MSSIERALAGDALLFELKDERTHVMDAKLLEEHGRNARTLVKEAALRITMIALAPGGSIEPHRAAGPISVQVLEGAVRFTAAGKEYSLSPGQVLVVAEGVEHEVRSDGGGLFLLTVVHGG